MLIYVQLRTGKFAAFTITSHERGWRQRFHAWLDEFCCDPPPYELNVDYVCKESFERLSDWWRIDFAKVKVADMDDNDTARIGEL